MLDDPCSVLTEVPDVRTPLTVAPAVSPSSTCTDADRLARKIGAIVSFHNVSVPDLKLSLV